MFSIRWTLLSTWWCLLQACVHAFWRLGSHVCVLYNLYGCCKAFFVPLRGIKDVSVVVAPFQPQLTKTTIVTKKTGWNQTKIHRAWQPHHFPSSQFRKTLIRKKTCVTFFIWCQCLWHLFNFGSHRPIKGSQRLCQVELICSQSITEVIQHWALMVLGGETASEHWVLVAWGCFSPQTVLT